MNKPPIGVIDQQYELVEVGNIKPHPDNANLGDLPLIKGSLEQLGFYGACVVQKSSRLILAGNFRYQAAVQRGIPKVPVIWVDVDDATAKRIMLVDNKSRDGADTDNEKLLALLNGLDSLLGTGYDEDELHRLQKLLGKVGGETNEPDVSMGAALVEKYGVASGQLWVVGGHRIVCGDSKDTAAQELVMGGAAPRSWSLTRPMASATARSSSRAAIRSVAAGRLSRATA